MDGKASTAVVDSGAQVSDMGIQLNPEATIRGKVLDEAGKPVTNAAVEALLEKRSRGQLRVSSVAKASSDKFGSYTLDGLIPGRYYVAAEIPQGAAGTSTIRFYYPSALSADDTAALPVQPGQGYADTDIHTRHVVTHRIMGRVAGLESVDHSQSSTLLLERQNGLEWSRVEKEVRLGPDGRFEIEGVLAGSYMLRLKGSGTYRIGGTQAKRLYVHVLAKEQIEVGGADVTDVVLAIPPPITVTGRVVLEGSRAQDVAQTQVSIWSSDRSVSSGYSLVKPEADGTFAIPGCDPSRYAVRVGAPAGTYVQRIEFNRQDALTHVMDLSGGAGGELVVTLRTGAATVRGTIQSGNGTAGLKTAVLIPDGWNPEVGPPVRRNPIQSDGFVFTDVAPGAYILVAVEGVAGNSEYWQDPDFVRGLQSAGQAVEVRESDSKQITVPLVSDGEVTQMAARLGLSQ